MSKELINFINTSNKDRNIDARNRVINNYEIRKVSKNFEENYNIVN